MERLPLWLRNVPDWLLLSVVVTAISALVRGESFSARGLLGTLAIVGTVMLVETFVLR